MIEPPEVDLGRALALRAIVRAVRGCGICSVALAVLAVAFLGLARGELTAQSLPQVCLLGVGWLYGAGCALTAARAAARLQSRADQPRAATRSVEVLLGRAVATLPLVALACSALLIALLHPRQTTVVSVVVSLAILSQLVLVLLTLRGGLRRAGRRLARTPEAF